MATIMQKIKDVEDEVRQLVTAIDSASSGHSRQKHKSRGHIRDPQYIVNLNSKRHETDKFVKRK